MEKEEFLVVNKEKKASYFVEIENVMGFQVGVDLTCDKGVQFYNFEK